MPSHGPRTLVTRSSAETEREGARVAALLRPGDLVILTGSLGAGKTVFVRGMARGLGLDPDEVHSPSFTMVSEYGPAPSGRRLVHVDLYRIGDPRETEELGLAEQLDDDRVMAVEWGEKLPDRLRRGAIVVTIEDAGGDRRRVSIAAPA